MRALDLIAPELSKRRFFLTFCAIPSTWGNPSLVARPR
jgi:hypothetical protein